MGRGCDGDGGCGDETCCGAATAIGVFSLHLCRVYMASESASVRCGVGDDDGVASVSPWRKQMSKCGEGSASWKPVFAVAQEHVTEQEQRSLY